MTETEKIAAGMFVMIGLIAGGLWLSSTGSNGPKTFDEVARTMPAQPVAATQSAVTETRPATTERYYRDRHGAIVSERETERTLEQIRNNIRSMPDSALRAYREGQLQFLEEEWARMKRQGPVEPLRAVDGRGKEILIGEAPLPESKRRKIFYELVQAQDAGVGDREAYTLIARRYGLPEMMLNEIAHEGAAKKWPMP